MLCCRKAIALSGCTVVLKNALWKSTREHFLLFLKCIAWRPRSNEVCVTISPFKLIVFTVHQFVGTDAHVYACRNGEKKKSLLLGHVPIQMIIFSFILLFSFMFFHDTALLTVSVVSALAIPLDVWVISLHCQPDISKSPLKTDSIFKALVLWCLWQCKLLTKTSSDKQ